MAGGGGGEPTGLPQYVQNWDPAVTGAPQWAHVDDCTLPKERGSYFSAALVRRARAPRKGHWHAPAKANRPGSFGPGVPDRRRPSQNYIVKYILNELAIYFIGDVVGSYVEPKPEPTDGS